MSTQTTMKLILGCCFMALCSSVYGLIWTKLKPVELIRAGEADEIITVEAYSVPSVADWNNDGLADLIVGEGPTFLGDGIIRLYLNTGTALEPAFADGYTYVQDGGSRLEVPAEGCLGAFPRVVQWDGDGKKDLLVSLSDGTIRLYLNTGTDAAPVFSGWQPVEAGPAGSKAAIDVGSRACCIVNDWNSDGAKDLVIGNMAGTIVVYLNEGTDTNPDFVSSFTVQEDGAALVVPEIRSSPTVADLNGDGKKDLVVGDTEGYLSLYLNIGTDENPTFSGYTLLESGCEIINLPHDTPSFWARSRPFLCDWTGDGYWDILVGTNSYGKVYLFEGLAGDFEPDGDVDLDDFVVFASWWMDPACESFDECLMVDLSGDGQVLLDDLQLFVANWLGGCFY